MIGAVFHKFVSPLKINCWAERL